MKAFLILASSALLSSATPYDGIMCDSDIECEEATGYPYDTAFDPDAPKYPRLVGHGCKGAKGPICAFEEEHLPKCREIVAMNWDWRVQ
jgi:hypothetical protein